MTDSRLFLVRIMLVWLLLELLAATQARTPDGSPVAWRWIRTGAAPLVNSSSKIGSSVGHFMDNIGATSRMLVDSHRMRLELEELRARNLTLEEDLASLRDASALLDGVVVFESDSLVGRCVFRDPARGRMEIAVKTLYEINLDTPVFTGSGLVGRVVQSRGQRSWVELLTHPAAAAAVQTADGSLHALATGTGRIDQLEILFVPRTAEILQGTVLVTSGADGIYPPGIPVASVASVRETDAAFLEVQASPTADLTTLRVVLLLPTISSGPLPAVVP